MSNYKTFTELFLEKYNKRSYGVETTRHYIKENYPCVRVPSSRQVFRWIASKK